MAEAKICDLCKIYFPCSPHTIPDYTIGYKGKNYGCFVPLDLCCDCAAKLQKWWDENEKEMKE